MSILELSIALPVRVQNGGLFISRGVGSHPARKLNSWEIIFVEKGILTIQEESTIFQVNAGESLVLWPERQHIGVGDFPDNLKFYWLHFEMMNEAQSGESLTKLNLPQHVKVSDPPYMISLFRQFLNEQESMARSVALELTLLLILQHVAQGADHQARQEDAGAALAWKAQQCIRTHYHLPLHPGWEMAHLSPPTGGSKTPAQASDPGVRVGSRASLAIHMRMLTFVPLGAGMHLVQKSDRTLN